MPESTTAAALPTHAPPTAKQPAVRLRPPIDWKVLVAVVKLAMPCMESKEPGVEVPMPMLPLLLALETMKDGEELPDTHETNCGVVDPAVADCTESIPHGVEVPRPRFVPLNVSAVPEVIRIPSKKFTPLVTWVEVAVPPLAIGKIPETCEVRESVPGRLVRERQLLETEKQPAVRLRPPVE